MKRKYGTRVTELISGDIIVYIIFILAVISGSVYALYIKDKDNTAFVILNQYLQSDMKTAFEMKKALSSFWDYLKQLIMLWIFGFFDFTIPFCMMILFAIVFAYTFTTTCVILIYGIKGLVIVFCAYGFQAVIMLITSLYLVTICLRKSKVKADSILGQYRFGIIPIFIGSVVMTGFDIITALNLQNITNRWL